MRRFFLAAVLLLTAMNIQAQGLPFISNILATQYGGHNQNFDVITDDKGCVYVANFEGLLYYNNASWSMLHTPGVTRIISLYRDSKGVIWTGGYNYIGYLDVKENGALKLQRIDNQNMIRGEVQQIWEKQNRIYFKDTESSTFQIINNIITPAYGHHAPKIIPDNINPSWHANQVLELTDGIKAIATSGQGVIIVNSKMQELFRLTEENGLCSNNVNHLAYDGNGVFWGATDNGIFAVGFPSIYTRFTPNEGLRGEVLSIQKLGQQMYVGTLNGLFRMNGKRFTPVIGVNHACWQLEKDGESLLAATANGVYRIDKNGTARQLTLNNTLSVMATDQGFYSGEIEGTFLHQNGKKSRVSDVEKVVQITTDHQGNIWLRNLYGKIWNGSVIDGVHHFYADKSIVEAATLVQVDDQLMTITANSTHPFPYPSFSYKDPEGMTWLTNNKGKALYAYNKGAKNPKNSQYVLPFDEYSFRAMFVEGAMIWMGGDKGINIVDRTHEDPSFIHLPNLYIRSVKLQGDSLLWGGYSQQIQSLPTLSSNNHHLTIEYSTDMHPLQKAMKYRHRLDDGPWSSWEQVTFEEYPNLNYGSHVFEVQARDAFDRMTNVASMSFTISYPFYLKWYMILLYFIVAIYIIILLMKLRLRRLQREKMRLENIVQVRTAEVVRQKDEIEEKSKSLETALNELGEAQHELVRQEKMATVGKLTQGLIDRILNPLNYINNFAKLSEGLVRDVTANIEEEKDHMDKENYEDTIDVLDMLEGNLKKVGEHGANTTRTLKAMEEMLKDRSGGMSNMNLTALLRQNEEMVHKYFEKEISSYHIKVTFSYLTEDVMINGNAEQLSKTFMSLLGNAIYAVVKKAQRQTYTPEVSLSMETLDKYIAIKIRDNGVGIEKTIIDKIFDPFFTTKTTSEAAGVGLYLSHEIAQNHGGNITVQSQKDTYTEFTITLPKQ